MIKPPFPWFGGKSRAASLIWERLGDVDNYVEPFAGSLAVMLRRSTPPKIETVNDKDRFVANFWRAVQHDPEAVAIAADNPVNECDLEARHAWLIQHGIAKLAAVLSDPRGFDAEIAGWWVWGQCCWIGSGWCSGEGPWRVENGEWTKRNPGQGVNRKRPHLRNPGQGVNRQLPHLGNPGQGVNRQLPHLGDPGQARREHLVAYMRELAGRLRHVRVCCGDWSRVVTHSPMRIGNTTGVVLDPPYLEATSKRTKLYSEDDYSIANAVREWAIEWGRHDYVRIALCGYEGEHDMPDDWTVVEWKAAGGYASTASGDTTGKANRHRERIWFSPACVKVESTDEMLIPA